MLVPHLITALADEDANGTGGKNIVASAVCTMHDAETGGNAIILYDDENGNNGATSKLTDANGQVVVYATPGEYWKSVNGGTRRKVVFGNVGAFYGTAAEIAALRPIRDGQIAYATDRANAPLISSTTATAQPGDITAANGNVWVLQDLENFRAYGNVDDSVDCGPLIETVLNSGRSNIYKFRGNFTVDTPSEINGISDLTIDCYGAYFDCSNMYGDDIGNNPDALFKVFGSSVLTTTLSADGAQDSTTVTLASTSGILPGMPITIKTDQHWYTESGSIGRAYVGEVGGVSGSVVTLQEPLPFDFTVSGFSITVEVCSPAENVSVVGGSFFGGNYRRDLPNGVGIGVVFAKYYKNLDVNLDYVDGFENIAIRAEMGVNANVHDFDIQGHAPDFGAVTEGVNSGFYGVFFVDTRNAIMSNVTGYRCRHLQDASRTYNMKVTDCTGVNCHRPALGCHSGTHDGEYNNCSVDGGFGGLQWRGFHLYVHGGNINCPNNASSGIYDADGGVTDLKSRRVIKPSSVRAERVALDISGSFEHCSVSGDYENTDSSYSCVDFSGNYIGYVDFQAKVFQAGGSGVAVNQSSNSTVELQMFRVTNSYISSDTNLIRVYAPASTGAVWIEGNVFDSSAATYDININNAQTFERVENNYRPDGTAATRNP